MDTVRRIVWAKNKIYIRFPFTKITETHDFGHGEFADILTFGFSYIEHEDHLVEHVIFEPIIAKKVIREIEPVQLAADKSYIGTLWTGKLYISDKIPPNHILFSNSDLSVILDLNLNKMEA
jgi:hypothetical protein